MRIIPFTKEHRHHFESLNREWIEAYFKMEPLDVELLCNPEKMIIDKGGTILFMEHEGAIIGTVALVLTEDGVYELAKMGVSKRYQGLGAGKLLVRAALDEARYRGATKVILYTSSKLDTALRIYRKLGFREVPMSNSKFERGDVKMELCWDHN